MAEDVHSLRVGLSDMKEEKEKEPDNFILFISSMNSRYVSNLDLECTPLVVRTKGQNVTELRSIQYAIMSCIYISHFLDLVSQFLSACPQEG